MNVESGFRNVLDYLSLKLVERHFSSDLQSVIGFKAAPISLPIIRNNHDIVLIISSLPFRCDSFTE